ncbi:TetR family transcriptional regulator [Modestobacter versicolor]|nr:TetR/AcrR family transcriptional regulator [Modestobacter versicolor]PZA23124.1 TetR family transcriptional regulator [Modestobacter versicolor]
MVIIDAALTRFAADGFDRATTAAICRTAGIGSGTFFHYFPTKLDVLLAILELGTAETAAWFAAQQGRADAGGVLGDYVVHAATEYADPRVAGFVKAVGAVMNDERVAAALARDEAVVADGLLPWVRAAQAAGEVRSDVEPARLCAWVLVVLDGFLGRLAGETGFDAAAEQDMLIDTVQRLLAVRSG